MIAYLLSNPKPKKVYHDVQKQFNDFKEHGQRYAKVEGHGTPYGIHQCGAGGFSLGIFNTLEEDTLLFQFEDTGT